MNLLPLALQALVDVDAREVLHDAIEESEWNDRRAVVLTFGEEPGQGTGLQFRTAALTKLQSGVRAILAVLLFGDWPTRWPLAEENARRAYLDELTQEADRLGMYGRRPGRTARMVQEAVERALVGEAVLIMAANEREADRIDRLCRDVILERIRRVPQNVDPEAVWRRIWVESPGTEHRLRGRRFDAQFEDHHLAETRPRPTPRGPFLG